MNMKKPVKYGISDSFCHNAHRNVNTKYLKKNCDYIGISHPLKYGLQLSDGLDTKDIITDNS